MSDSRVYDRLKHLDYIQAVIARLANNSFLMKGWALTLCSALLGLSASRAQASLALLALAPAAAFSLLDAYYLRQERAFRSMFRDVSESTELAAFEMNPRPYAKKEPWCKAIFSFSIAAFYGLIFLVSLLVWGAVASQPEFSGPPTGVTTSPSMHTSPTPTSSPR